MIEVRELEKSYGEHHAVRGISFTVEKGDIFGFIGPNGAGKTTTIRIAATLLDASGGDVRIAGHSVTEAPYAVRRVLGYMPDLFNVYDGITVREYLDFFAAANGLHRRDRARTLDAVLDLTDLRGVAERLSGGLSKGMKQRLCLARTLLHDPQVLVLDEPASGLDPRARIEFRALLKELRTMGKTILLSSHILTELSDVCNAVAIMEKGRVVAAGAIESIRDQLQGKRCFVLTVLDRADEACRILEASGSASRVQRQDLSVRFQLEGELPKAAELVKAICAADVPVVGLREESANLEGLFMQLTRGEVV